MALFVDSPLLGQEYRTTPARLHIWRKYRPDRAFLPSLPDGSRCLGYDFGLLCMRGPARPRGPDDLLAHMLALKDSAGMWAEYYDGGQPQNTRCRPWEAPSTWKARCDIFAHNKHGEPANEYGNVCPARKSRWTRSWATEGLCGIFRTIGCVGDSLSSGEFESLDANGNKTYHDMFEYSWGQYLARMAKADRAQFLRGGMTAKEYCESFAGANGYWSPIWPARPTSSRWA